MKRYLGTRGASGCDVCVEDEGRRYPLRHVVRHSPDGFEWGYGGSGPADLALSILTDAAGPETAERWYMQFKWQVISRLARVAWELTEQQVRDWLKQRQGGRG